MRAEEVTISDTGGANAKRVPVIAASCSWEISNVGTFSAFTRTADLYGAGLTSDLRGKWLEYSHPTAGAWGGVITGKPAGTGLVELAAEGWATLLGGHEITGWSQAVTGQAGALAARAVQLVQDEITAYITLGVVEEGGVPVTIDFSTQDVLSDLLPHVTQDGGVEWIVDSRRVFHTMRKLGVDLSATVRLVEGAQIIDATVGEEERAQPPSEVIWVESVRHRINREHRQSRAWGRRRRRQNNDRRRQRVGGWAGAGHPGRRGAHRVTAEISIAPGPEHVPFSPSDPENPLPHWSLAVPFDPHIRPPTTPLQLTVRDIDGIWQDCQVGNLVRVLLRSGGGFSGRFRIVSRALDMANGELALAGEALSDAVVTA